jgi:hypothetical protein
MLRRRENPEERDVTNRSRAKKLALTGSAWAFAETLTLEGLPRRAENRAAWE